MKRQGVFWVGLVLLGVVLSSCTPHIVYDGRFGGYETSSYYLRVKVFNARANEIEVRCFGRTKRLAPGGEASWLVQRLSRSRRVVLTAVEFGPGGGIKGTAAKKMTIPQYRRGYAGTEEKVWYVDRMDRLRGR